MEPLFEKLRNEAAANKQRIILPESFEPRTLTAADRFLEEGLADIVLLGNTDKVQAEAQKLGLKNIGKATFIDPDDEAVNKKYGELFYELRKNKGITMEQACATAKNPLYLGCLIIKNGDADGQVAGALNTTGNVLRAAFQVLKTAPGIKVVSGAFIMLLPESAKQYGDNGILVLADCAVMPFPKADELAQIAVCTAKTAHDLGGIKEPKVAMLSFSTKGSAKHENVDKVIEATRLAKEMAPDLAIDGELQADAALVPSVGATKAPGSEIAGKANVLVFPDLGVGNIAYKLIQRLAGATAVGPVLQGLAAPVNDLSRGCSADDIYKTLLLTCNQAINRNK